MRKNILLILVFISLFLISCQSFMLRAFRASYGSGHITASTDDAKFFSNNVIHKKNSALWKKDTNYNKVQLGDSLLKHLIKYRTISFLIIKDGKLWFEKYFKNFDTAYASNSFSMAKSITSILLGCALKDKYIESLDQKITDFLPEFKNDSMAKFITIKSLVKMSSGYDWVENYFVPWNPTTKAYYGTDLDKTIFSRGFIDTPNKKFKYLSGTTQLLGYVIKRATKKTLAEYASEKLWQPLEMEQNALWSTDHENGMEKAFCCVHSNARDFAKLGQLLLQKGNWKGQQILDTNYIEQAIRPDVSKEYGFSFWMDYENNPPFYMFRGHLGQYIINVPSHNLVIVRLGENRPFKKNKNPNKILREHIYDYVSESIRMIKSLEK